MNEKPLKEMVKVIDNTIPYEEHKAKKDPEKRDYLICVSDEREDYGNWWMIVNGRTNAYETLKEIIKDDHEYIDFEESFIMVETITMQSRKSFYAFMKYCKQFYTDDFNIDDYIKGDLSENVHEDEEDETNLNREVDPSMYVNNAEKIDMASLMNGEVSTSDLN